MQIKTYIIITMFLIVFIITYHANIFGKHKEFFDAKTGIIKPNNANIDNLKEQFNFRPSTSVIDGVSNFVKWYKNYYQL